MKKYVSLVTLMTALAMLCVNVGYTQDVPVQVTPVLEPQAFLPQIFSSRKPLPPIPACRLSVLNYTGSTMMRPFCYEVLESGIDRFCTPHSGGTFYGTFPAGTYEWCAWTTEEGEVCAEDYFGIGYTSHTFWPDFADDPPTPIGE